MTIRTKLAQDENLYGATNELIGPIDFSCENLPQLTGVGYSRHQNRPMIGASVMATMSLNTVLKENGPSAVLRQKKTIANSVEPSKSTPCFRDICSTG